MLQLAIVKNSFVLILFSSRRHNDIMYADSVFFLAAADSFMFVDANVPLIDF